MDNDRPCCPLSPTGCDATYAATGEPCCELCDHGSPADANENR